ncbi:MAG: hypothetical protein IKO74_03325 [Selenomonadaceae bacterium]|nr:hypothetical protein [Selenomonadaceae bacterium]
MTITNERLNSGALKIFVAGRLDVLNAAAPKVEDVLNEFVDAEKSSPYVQVSFKKFLRDKATYSAEKIFVVSAGEEYIWKEIIAADLQKKCSARQSRCDLQRELD